MRIFFFEAFLGKSTAFQTLLLQVLRSNVLSTLMPTPKDNIQIEAYLLCFRRQSV